MLSNAENGAFLVALHKPGFRPILRIGFCQVKRFWPLKLCKADKKRHFSRLFFGWTARKNIKPGHSWKCFFPSAETAGGRRAGRSAGGERMEDDGQGGQLGEQVEDDGQGGQWESRRRTTGRAISWGSRRRTTSAAASGRAGGAHAESASFTPNGVRGACHACGGAHGGRHAAPPRSWKKPLRGFFIRVCAVYTRVGTAGGYAHALRFAATHGWASYDIFFNDFIHLWSGVGRGNLNMAEIGNINRKKNKKAACPLGVPLKKEKVKSAMLQISLIYIIVEKMKEIAILNGQKNNQRHHLQKCNKVRLWLSMVEHRRFELLTPTLPVLCATNCANAPSTSISIPWKAAFVNHELPILFLQKNGLHAACTCAVTSRDRNSIRGGNCEKET